MLSNLSISLTILLLAVPRAWSTYVIDFGTCATQPTLDTAVAEALAMANFAYDRTEGATNGSLPLLDQNIINGTFDAFFGNVSQSWSASEYEMLKCK
jgi:hypothetical protein